MSRGGCSGGCIRCAGSLRGWVGGCGVRRGRADRLRGRTGRVAASASGRADRRSRCRLQPELLIVCEHGLTVALSEQLLGGVLTVAADGLTVAAGAAGFYSGCADSRRDGLTVAAGAAASTAGVLGAAADGLTVVVGAAGPQRAC